MHPCKSRNHARVYTREVYVQFERRTEASASVRLLRSDTDESFEQRRNIVGGE
jgi:hypothetical protein